MTSLPDDAKSRLVSALGDRYVVGSEIGSGGMAIVYRATDLKHGRPVAIKVMRPEIAAAMGKERFSSEITFAARLQHLNILALIDSGDADGLLFYIMPLLEGETLAQRIARGGKLPVSEAMRITTEVVSALRYAHEHGVLHRDIKPANIMLTGGHAVVMDFGIARAMNEAATRLTAPGMLMGTPAYMGPEYLNGEGDPRSDIYAVGCVLYEMLAGSPPFTGATAQAILLRHFAHSVPELSGVRSDVPRRVELLVMRALEKEPNDRFPNMEAFQAALLTATGASSLEDYATDATRAGSMADESSTAAREPRAFANSDPADDMRALDGIAAPRETRRRGIGAAARRIPRPAIAVGVISVVATVGYGGYELLQRIIAGQDTVAVATVVISPSDAYMSGGGTKQLTATLYDANRNVVTGPTVSWTSSDDSKATVVSKGPVTALVTAAPVDAQVLITGTADGKRASTGIEIVAFSRMSVGGSFSCGLTSDGTYCWGANDKGQLGDSSQIPRTTPTRVATHVKFTAISSGAATTCALTENGAAYCWGANDRGQAGNGAVGKNELAPVPVSGSYKFTSIASGAGTSCGTTSNGPVYCWGLTEYENAPYSASPKIEPRPVRVGPGMDSVFAGLDNRFCTIDSDGLAYCWKPLFSRSRATPRITPPIREPVSTTHHFTLIRVGYEHACGIVSSGEAYCWGRNNFGQLGDGTTKDRATPTPVSRLLRFDYLAAGGGFAPYLGEHGAIAPAYSCALTRTHKAYCWGGNVQGQLGLGFTSPVDSVPREVFGGIGFSGLRAGSAHTCGLSTNGSAYCWGNNAKGQLGNGTMTSVDHPAPVWGQ